MADSSKTPQSGDRTTEALALAEETLAQLELGQGRLMPIVLRCLRLARLVENEDAETLFRLELRGYPNDQSWDVKYAKWSGREANKTPEGTQLYWINPIEVIEGELEIARAELETLKLTPMSISEVSRGEADQKLWMSPTPAQKMLTSILKERRQRANDMQRWTHVVACLRGTIQEWLSNLVIRLRYGTIVDTVLQQTKQRFDQFLSKHAPEVGRKLASAYGRADSGESEEWSQALTSCRRALKALADAIYPATEDKPAGHDLSEESYKNRLLQFVSENLPSESQGALINAEVESVARRVDALNELASKGVHSDVEWRDVELTVVHTYLVAGEILGFLPEEEEEAPLVTPPPATDKEQSSSGTTEEPANGDDTSANGLPGAHPERVTDDEDKTSDD